MDNTDRKRLSPGLSDSESDAADDDEETFEYAGVDAGDTSYSSRMEELLAGDDEHEDTHENGSILGGYDDDEDAGFLYTGVDSLDTSITGYKDRLRDVLGPDDSGMTDESSDELEADRSLPALASADIEEKDIAAGKTELGLDTDDEPLPNSLEHDFSTPSHSPSMLGSPSRGQPPAFKALYDSPPSSYPIRPFLHPHVSRLRSFTPQGSRVPSAVSSTQSNSNFFGALSPSPSHFSSMSPTSSVSGLPDVGTSNPNENGRRSAEDEDETEVFRWTSLRAIGNYIYSQGAQKAATLLGSPSMGSPTVLAANGLICVGTDEGKIVVYDFKQTLKCVCGGGEGGSTGSKVVLGPVTALALSHDHTYVAAGHASGHIQLFDLKNPNTPARFVPPTNLATIRSGRKEGHLKGSRIVNVGFIAGRHTAIVSADEHGLAFYHSLGKVLFVEASDILRILGKYPEVDIDDASNINSKAQKLLQPPVIPPRKSRYRVLAMMPLPLGTASHPTDTYQVIALLTPSKLVVVALKPTPRTWFKRPRNYDEKYTQSKTSGTLAWYPSVSDIIGNSGNSEEAKPPPKKGEPQTHNQTTPALVYSWSDTFNVIRVTETKVKQTIKNEKTGKAVDVEIGQIICEDIGKWKASGNIVALQWLNANQIIVVSTDNIEVFDLSVTKVVERVAFASTSLRTPLMATESYLDVGHSVRVYKGKIFLLGKDELKVGTLLTWADRILSFVQDGDFLKAIDLARSYYLGNAPGNRNGLPADTETSKLVTGQKMKELMTASSRYAFSEDRMKDTTHYSADGRGVDRTTLFEGIVTTCAKACIALDDFEFLFEDLFQQYDDAGISRIYLLRLEKFILDGTITYIPPWITQRLLILQDEDGRPDLVERIIWHIDPTCLDLNQAIHMCQRCGLYDALIYVYTRGLKDYVAPIVELLGLIRRIQKYRNQQRKTYSVDTEMESVILNAYKIYPYLANVLSGLTYPSEEPLEAAEAFQAKKDVFNFLLYGHSYVWPEGESGRLVLTSDEDGVSEPTYPYTRLLLRFDPESFLHTLDIVFEDAYLTDDWEGGRLLIVRILLDILSSGDLSSADITFVNIFIARNVPKYSQFLFTYLPPTQLHGILVGLAEDPNDSTREDRQLAAEYLLSVYNPHDSEVIQCLFETAGFYRILRTWHRQDKQWASLLQSYIHDPAILSTEIFTGVNDAISSAVQSNRGTLPQELLSPISTALPQLLHASPRDTAILVDTHSPELHDKALDALSSDSERFAYLQCLLYPQADLDGHSGPLLPRPSSIRLEDRHRQIFISLQCQFNPMDVVEVLKTFPLDGFDWSQAPEICERHEVYDAAVWCLDWREDPRAALSKAETFEKKLTLDIVHILSRDDTISSTAEVRQRLGALQAVARTGVTICLRRSQPTSALDIPLEDIWFQLLSSQVNCVQNVSAVYYNARHDKTSADNEQSTLSTLRALVQNTFSSLVSISSTRAVSFPRLFKRLINPSAHPSTPDGSRYSEFRIILTGMLESYRSDEDILFITKRLLDKDLFDVMAVAAQERVKGWGPSRGNCSYCRRSLLLQQTASDSTSESDSSPSTQIVVSRTGVIYHSTCQPVEVSSSS